MREGRSYAMSEPIAAEHRPIAHPAGIGWVNCGKSCPLPRSTGPSLHASR